MGVAVVRVGEMGVGMLRCFVGVLVAMGFLISLVAGVVVLVVVVVTMKVHVHHTFMGMPVGVPSAEGDEQAPEHEKRRDQEGPRRLFA